MAQMMKQILSYETVMSYRAVIQLLIGKPHRKDFPRGDEPPRPPPWL